jgi:cytochrome c-type biogenesis protein CcmH
MIWLGFALLILAAFIIVLPPLLSPAAAKPRAQGDLAVYRDQLKEVDLDQDRGLISATEADNARTEIKRRILGLAGPAAPETVPAVAPSRVFVAAAAASVVGVSLGIYQFSGRPDLPARPHDPAAEREAVAESLVRDVETMVSDLAEKLKSRPDDAAGWRMLGWSYLQLGRVGDGIEALKRALALDPENGALRSQFGEALVREAEGKLTPGALAAFDEALKRDPKDPRARFYKGLALLQAGKDSEALDVWIAILRDGPSDADWFAGIQAQARGLATKLKLDPKTTVP